MPGRKEWRVQTSFRELILRAGSSLPQGSGADRAGEALLSHLMFALRGHHSEVGSTLRDVRDTAYGYRDADPAPAHFARPPYWRELDDVERDLRAALRSGMLTLEEIARRPGVAVAIEEQALAVAQLSPPRDAPLETSFEVRFVDEIGQAISGLQVEIAVGDRRERVPTNAAGVALLEGTTAGSGTVTVLDPAALEQILEPRWAKQRIGKAPGGL